MAAMCRRRRTVRAPADDARAEWLYLSALDTGDEAWVEIQVGLTLEPIDITVI